MMTLEVGIFAAFILSNLCAYRIGKRDGWNDHLRETLRAARRGAYYR